MGPPLQFAARWLEDVNVEAHADIERRFSSLTNRLKQALGGTLPKAAAGACLMIAVKAEDGACPPVADLGSMLGVSQYAIINWEVRALEAVDWTLGLTQATHDMLQH